MSDDKNSGVKELLQSLINDRSRFMTSLKRDSGFLDTYEIQIKQKIKDLGNLNRNMDEAKDKIEELDSIIEDLREKYDLKDFVAEGNPYITGWLLSEIAQPISLPGTQVSDESQWGSKVQQTLDLSVMEEFLKDVK